MSDRGSGMIEYVLLLALIAIIAVAALRIFASAGPPETSGDFAEMSSLFEEVDFVALATEVAESHTNMAVAERTVEISSPQCDAVIRDSLGPEKPRWLNVSLDGEVELRIGIDPDRWAPIGSPLIDEFVCGDAS